MNGIIAINRLGFIGLDGQLPWYCMSDLKHFKRMTTGGICIVGHKTKKTLPNLKGRIVVEDGTPEHLQAVLENTTQPVWIIGGKATYEKYAPDLKTLHISHIHDDTIGDTMMPDLRYLNPKCEVFHYYFTTIDNGTER